MPYTYCQDFDLVWILLNANLIPNISLLFHHYEPTKYLRILDVTGILVLWYLLYQIWNKIDKIHKAMKAKQFKTRQKTPRIAESHSNKIGGSWYQLWPKILNLPIVQNVKQVITKSKMEKSNGNEINVSFENLLYSCHNGDKDNLKDVLENDFDLTKINETQENGNTPIHLGILGNHLPVVQILLSKFGKELKLSIRNNDGYNPLDLAVINKNNAIAKLLLKHTKVEVSSLIHAVMTDQTRLVQIFHEKLKKTLERNLDLEVPLQRFVDLSKEVESKSTTEERKNACKGNLEVYKKHICTYLMKTYYSQGIAEKNSVFTEYLKPQPFKVYGLCP